MAFLHLADTYTMHPKFRALSDGAFRLWHEGMCFARMWETDGAIPAPHVEQLPHWTAERAAELQRPCTLGGAPLWEPTADGGVSVHDYLVWNVSKVEAAATRGKAKARMAKARIDGAVRENERRTALKNKRRTTSANAHARASRNNARTNGEVLDQIRSDQIKEDPDPEKDEPKIWKPHDVETDAAAILDAFRAQWRTCYGHECSILITALQHMQLVQQAEQHPLAELLRAVAAFFASSDAYVTQAKHPWALWIRDPLKYLATAKVAPDFQAELAAIVAKGPSVRPS